MGELFAGIGGFSLGFRRAGFDVVWQVEIEPYCRKVLEKNFPEAERYNDVREVGSRNLQRVDVIAGGFPCQDISLAGKGAGITGERSGLWKEFARIVGELRPRFVVVENVSALLVRGIDSVLGELASLGYDAEWRIISAADMGAPHLRRRIWIVAYPASEQDRRVQQPRIFANAGTGGAYVADTVEQQQDGGMQWTCRWEREPAEALQDARRRGGQEAWMSITESLLGRVAHGIPARVDRLRALGNAVVPQIPEWIARRILEAA